MTKPTTGNSSSYTIRYFLDWAAARQLTPPLTVPTLPRQDPEQILDEADRWDLLQRCLTDETMPLDTRAAGALVLLFGLPLSRIRHLTIDQLDITDTRSFLRTGRHPLLLPPRLAELIHQLAETLHFEPGTLGGDSRSRSSKMGDRKSTEST